MSLLYLLLDLIKHGAVKELAQTDLQPVAELLDGDDAGIPALFVEHAVNRGGRHAGDIRQSVDSHVVLFTKFNDPLCYSLFCVHYLSPDIDYINRLYKFTINRVGHIAIFKI